MPNKHTFLYLSFFLFLIGNSLLMYVTTPAEQQLNYRLDYNFVQSRLAIDYNKTEYNPFFGLWLSFHALGFFTLMLYLGILDKIFIEQDRIKHKIVNILRKKG